MVEFLEATIQQALEKELNDPNPLFYNEEGIERLVKAARKVAIEASFTITVDPAVEIYQQSMERALKAVELRRSGLKLKEIGERLGGLSMETVRQAVKKGERILERRAKYGPPL